MDSHSTPALVVADLHKSFGSHEVLKGVGMTARQGDVISMIGSSGSGKSTFLRCINLLEIPNFGTVTVQGERIDMLKTRSGETKPADMRHVERIRSRLAMVFQGFNLWAHMTVLENVTAGPVHVLKQTKAEAVERAESMLHRVGMFERRNYFPAHLSGGQQQRAAIDSQSRHLEFYLSVPRHAAVGSALSDLLRPGAIRGRA